MASIAYSIKLETRLCKVRDEYGYFHTWEQFSEPIAASPLQWGHPAGVLSRVYGIVEFEDRVRRVDIDDIVFCDEKSSELAVMNKYWKEKENSNA